MSDPVIPDTRWFVCPRPNPSAGWRLFCFPYAGGGAPVFRGWGDALPDAEVWVAQLPGRGARIKEAPLTRLEVLVDSLAGEITPLLDRPAAYFGHSMGALIAFELARELRRAATLAADNSNQPGPGWPLSNLLHLFVSACAAPHWSRSGPPIHALPEAKFREELRRLNGTSEELLNHDELMRLLLPALRADFEAVETYEYAPEEPLPCPITAFGGTDDEQVAREQLSAWGAQTSIAFELEILPGDHFFLHATRANVLGRIQMQISQITRFVSRP